MARKQPVEPTTTELRSEAAKASWANKKIAKARATRHQVKVGRTVYKSLAEAFKDLGLPLSKHIAFRQKLKAEGRAKFEGHTFNLVSGE